MIDIGRHREIFPAEEFNSTIDIIGAGATGSKVAMSLAKLGISNIRVWDFDDVEEHNIANQLYGTSDIGKKKVEALYERILSDTGTKIQKETIKFTGGEEQDNNIVFLLTDTMSSRKEIWKNGLKYKPHVQRVIETRMGSDNGRCYSVDPMDMDNISKWEQTLYDDDVAEESSCGTRISVGPTAGFLAELAVWQFIRWFNVDRGKEEDLELINWRLNYG